MLSPHKILIEIHVVLNLWTLSLVVNLNEKEKNE